MDEGETSADRDPNTDASGIYVYCFAFPAAARHVDAVGLDGQEKVEESPRRLEDSPWRVDALEVGGVAAVCSRVPLESFTGACGEANLQDPSWIISRACQHERIIEQVMAHSPVLPVRFGAVFSSTEALAAVLSRNRERIVGFLQDVSDKQEWSVKATVVNPKEVEENLLRTDGVLAEELKGIPKSPGAGYLHEKRLHAEARKRWKTYARTLAGEILDALKTGVADVCLLTPRSADLSPRGAEMIFNGAFLLLRDRVAAFRDQVAELGEDYVKRGVSLEVTGPWPPYSFCPAILTEKEKG